MGDDDGSGRGPRLSRGKGGSAERTVLTDSSIPTETEQLDASSLSI